MQLIDKVFDVSVVQDQPYSSGADVEKTVESPQLQLVEALGAIPLVQLLDKVVVPVVCNDKCLGPDAHHKWRCRMVFHGSRLLGQGCGHARCCARLVLWSRRAEAVLGQG